ncbi:PDR/VanB family oxidoreductase [Variovorax sp. PCZ-1]|uniref:PDR/VanB family oxidoreductase n=1 Tax=Variovorax sp. PCZ-1 TaxID=2835533 RepID=UPI001BCE2399|nr:PDR/VanB family oxidoreductase [Variovorax sp. PCZ-1]MBS7806916.1 oxidoreductase [Variovorax sp. PCZ-1]
MKIASLGMSAQVAHLRDITPTVREFSLRLAADVPPAAYSWQPGAHIQVQIPVQGQLQTRHYSLLPCDEPGMLSIAVKRAEPGRGGSQAMWRLQEGDALSISAPLNHFHLDLKAPAYLLIAGGIGITPLLSMARQLKLRYANFQMIYGARDAQELAFHDDLKRLLGDRLHTVVGSAIDFSPAIAALPTGAQAYVCGPAGMLASVREAWGKQDRAPSLLRFETFGSAGAEHAFEVNLPRHDLSFEVSPEMSLLDALELQGVSAMYGCRKGECGLCAVRVLALDGSIEHRDVFFSEHEKHSNTHICVCVSRVRGRITLDSAYRSDAIAAIATSSTR